MQKKNHPAVPDSPAEPVCDVQGQVSDPREPYLQYRAVYPER